MKKTKPTIYTIIILFVVLINPNLSFAKYLFGSSILDRYEKKMIEEKINLVVFPHWIHTLWYKCKACHNETFIPESGANDITMKDINNGKQCGLCHNGDIAFPQKECKRCHSLSSDEIMLTLNTSAMRKRAYPGIFTKNLIEGETKKNSSLIFSDPQNVSISKLNNIADKLNIEWDKNYFKKKGFPKNRFNIIDYNKLVLEDKAISPKSFIGEKKKEDEIKNNHIIFEVLSDFVDDVIFPHNKHSYLLNCNTCHEKIFTSELGSNDIHEREIAEGKFCGYCHGKVSFPLPLCKKCHQIPKGEIKNLNGKDNLDKNWPGKFLLRNNPLESKKIHVSIKKGVGMIIIGEKDDSEVKKGKVAAVRAIEKMDRDEKKKVFSLATITKGNKQKPLKVSTKIKKDININKNDNCYSGKKVRARRHMPPEYDSAINPFPATLENIAEGKNIYLLPSSPAPCHRCHGKSGKGDGLMGKYLKVKSRDFTCTEYMSQLSDGHIFWVARKGTVGSGMAGITPELLNDEKLWKMILYIRSLAK